MGKRERGQWIKVNLVPTAHAFVRSTKRSHNFSANFSYNYCLAFYLLSTRKKNKFNQFFCAVLNLKLRLPFCVNFIIFAIEISNFSKLSNFLYTFLVSSSLHRISNNCYYFTTFYYTTDSNHFLFVISHCFYFIKNIVSISMIF